MDGNPIPERRRNPARKKEIDLAYHVIWSQSRRAFEIHRAGKSNGNYASDKSKAIELAIRDAKLDARPGLKVAVYSIHDGCQRTDWTS